MGDFPMLRSLTAFFMATAFSCSAIPEVSPQQEDTVHTFRNMLRFVVRDEEMEARTLEQFDNNLDAFDESMSMTETLAWLEGSGALELVSVLRDLQHIDLWSECRPMGVSSYFSPMAEEIVGITENDFNLISEDRLKEVDLYPQHVLTDAYSMSQAILENELPSLEIFVRREFSPQSFSIPPEQRVSLDNVVMEIEFNKPVIDIVTGLGTWAITWKQEFGPFMADQLPTAMIEAVDQFIAEYLEANERACQ
ncbi:MAG: hypothetical protein F4X09_12660 [Gammaproteobacteria bacterium]|nr:hypothetical protein [Gammaproteobacteria bacterium]